MPKALLFDLNGTMVDDMQYHIQAWYKILNTLGATITLEETKHQCYGKNDELLERIFPARFSIEEKREMSLNKEKTYQQTFSPHLKLITGLDTFLETVFLQHYKMAIGSAAIKENIDFVLNGLSIQKYFGAIVSADDVEKSKPHPETFLKCAALLNEPPENCIVFEDAPKGVEAAANAGMDCVVITTMHTANEFAQYANILTIINNYEQFNYSLLQ